MEEETEVKMNLREQLAQVSNKLDELTAEKKVKAWKLPFMYRFLGKAKKRKGYENIGVGISKRLGVSPENKYGEVKLPDVIPARRETIISDKDKAIQIGQIIPGRKIADITPRTISRGFGAGVALGTQAVIYRIPGVASPRVPQYTGSQEGAYAGLGLYEQTQGGLAIASF